MGFATHYNKEKEKMKKISIVTALALVAASATPTPTSLFGMNTDSSPTFDNTQENTNTGLTSHNTFSGDHSGEMGPLNGGAMGNTSTATGNWTSDITSAGITAGGRAENHSGANSSGASMMGATFNPMMSIAPSSSAMQSASNSSLQSHGGLTGSRLVGMGLNVGTGDLSGNELNRQGHTGDLTSNPSMTSTTTTTHTQTHTGDASTS